MGNEPRNNEIDGKITWVGIYPTKVPGDRRGSWVTFQHFVLFDADGPTLTSLAPPLARRMYEGRVRYLLKGYSNSEKAEAEQIIAWAMEATAGIAGEQVAIYKGFCLKCVCKTSKQATC